MIVRLLLAASFIASALMTPAAATGQWVDETSPLPEPATPLAPGIPLLDGGLVVHWSTGAQPRQYYASVDVLAPLHSAPGTLVVTATVVARVDPGGGGIESEVLFDGGAATPAGECIWVSSARGGFHIDPAACLARQ